MCRLDQPIVKLNALQALFDLLLLFGVQVFGQNESALDAPQRIKRRLERNSKDSHRTLHHSNSVDSRPGSASVYYALLVTFVYPYNLRISTYTHTVYLLYTVL